MRYFKKLTEDAAFYAGKRMLVFDKESSQVQTDEHYQRGIEHIKHAYEWCFFEHFMRWFGLAHVEKNISRASVARYSKYRKPVCWTG